jgi:hypothetical protein
MAEPGAIGGTTPAALTCTTFSSGGGGFTGDADGDTEHRSITITKQAGIAGSSLLYEANAADENGKGWMGPASVAGNTFYQFHNSDPTANQFMVFGAPVGGVSAQSWADWGDVPSGADPSTTSGGNTAVDTNDHFIEFYSDASRVVGALQCETFPIIEPDTIQGITDDVELKHFMADAFPHGVTIKDIWISASAAYTAETFLFEEWDDRAGSTQTTIESIVANAQTEEDDGALADPNLAADSYLMVNLDDTPEDMAQVSFTITYWINPGN